MTRLLLLTAAVLVASCGREEPPTPAENQVNVAEPVPEPVPPEPENETRAAALPLDPSEDPAVAAMSPYRRREYERGYRDCISGNFDPQRQGESYRLGCMTAENVKAGEEP
jgi:hypothetical protein